MEGISTNTDHWIRIYYIVFSATDAGADYKLLKVEGGVYGPISPHGAQHRLLNSKYFVRKKSSEGNVSKWPKATKMIEFNL